MRPCDANVVRKIPISRLQRTLREPLLHFLVLGVALFVVYARFGGVDGAPRERIVVDEARLSRLVEQFQRTWIRPPTRGELRSLAEDYVREEILYREALALGLDKDDLIIRRRLRQKMEFLNADLVEQQAPSEAELAAYLQANPDRFRRPARFSLQQIYFNPARQGADAGERAQALLARLRLDASLGSDPQALGDATLLPPVLEKVTAREIADTFGGEFADAVVSAGQGAWLGPYQSAYGLHLARLAMVEPGGMPVLAEVRSAVEREWTDERRREANERFYAALRGRYSVEIHLPETRDADKVSVRPR